MGSRSLIAGRISFCWQDKMKWSEKMRRASDQFKSSPFVSRSRLIDVNCDHVYFLSVREPLFFLSAIHRATSRLCVCKHDRSFFLALTRRAFVVFHWRLTRHWTSTRLCFSFLCLTVWNPDEEEWKWLFLGSPLSRVVSFYSFFLFSADNRTNMTKQTIVDRLFLKQETIGVLLVELNYDLGSLTCT